jgi:hypothetical protein
LLSAFAGSIAYIAGVTDAGNNLEQLWLRWLRDPRVPVYGKAEDLEQVRRQHRSLPHVVLHEPSSRLRSR